MISQEIVFHAPREIDEALELLAEDGDEVTVLSGGMSLVPMMNLGIVKPSVVLSLNHVEGLDYVTEDEEHLRIGACARHERVLRDPLIRRHCPVLSAAASVVGDPQVRHRGTIGGSVAHADPAADYLPVLAAVGARIGLRSRDQSRLTSPEEFFIDLMFTTREPSELVTEIVVPKQVDGAGAAYRRLARVEGSFAIVNAAAVVAGDGAEARVALGGVGPRPVVVDVSEQVTTGLDAAALETVEELAFAASAEASGDVLSDAEYRRAMARVYARRALLEAVDRSGGKGS